MKCCCQLGCPWLFRQSTRLRVDAGGYQPLSSPNTSRSRILILTICWACYSPPPRGIQKFGASLTSAPSWLSCARAWVSEACPCIPSRRNSQAARSLKSHPIMRRPGATLSTWWLSSEPTARRGRLAVGSLTASSKHRPRPSNVNCLDRSRFPLPPRLRVDGRRSGCWHRKQRKDVNSKLVCDLAAPSQFAESESRPCSHDKAGAFRKIGLREGSVHRRGSLVMCCHLSVLFNPTHTPSGGGDIFSRKNRAGTLCTSAVALKLIAIVAFFAGFHRLGDVTERFGRGIVRVQRRRFGANHGHDECLDRNDRSRDETANNECAP